MYCFGKEKKLCRRRYKSTKERLKVWLLNGDWKKKCQISCKFGGSFFSTPTKSFANGWGNTQKTFQILSDLESIFRRLRGLKGPGTSPKKNSVDKWIFIRIWRLCSTFLQNYFYFSKCVRLKLKQLHFVSFLIPLGGP